MISSKRLPIQAGAVLAMLVCVPSLAAAATAVTGTIGTDTTWHLADSPIDVTGNLAVASGATLTIEPGVIVEFEAGASLDVDGALVACGTAAAPIQFTSAQTPAAPGQWGYVAFGDSSVGASYDATGAYVSGSILEYVAIQDGGAPVNGSSGGALRLNDAGPLVSHATIQGNSGAGVVITLSQNGSAAPQIADSTIANNAQGIYLESGSSGPLGPITLIRNVIADNAYAGLDAYNVPGPLLVQGNTIKGNQTGIYAYTCCSATVQVLDNLVQANKGAGIEIAYPGSTTVDVERNRVVQNVGYYGSPGLFVQSSGNATIADNIVADNTSFSQPAVYLEDASGSMSVTGNTFTRNSVPAVLQVAATPAPPNAGPLIEDNTIVDNQAVSLGQAAVSFTHTAGAPETATSNNLNNPTFSYELRVSLPAASQAIEATQGWWGSADAAVIASRIYDQHVNASLEAVNYLPFLAGPSLGAPLSPPREVTLTPTQGGLQIAWAANPESDVVGYRVYYDTESGPDYAHFVDVGNTTWATLTGVPAGAYFVAVTAYDNAVHQAGDQFDGRESWFSAEVGGAIAPPPKVDLSYETIAPGPSPYGAAEAATIAFQIASGAAAPTGVITYQIDGGGLSSAPITASPSEAILPIGVLASGTHALAWSYAGDAHYNPISPQSVSVVVVPPPPPTLTGLTPNTIAAGSSDVLLHVTGANFVPGSAVLWNGAPLQTQFTDSMDLVATVPAASVASSGVDSVTVVDPAAAGGAATGFVPFVVTDVATTLLDDAAAGGTNGSVTTGGSGPGTPNSLTAGWTGTGTIVVAQFGSDPGAAFALGAGRSPQFFDVNVAAGGSLSALTITTCAPHASTVFWFDGTTWRPASDQSYDAATDCTTVSLSATSSPNVAQLSGTYFVAFDLLSRFVALSEDFTWLRRGSTAIAGDVGAVGPRDPSHHHHDRGDADDVTVRIGEQASVQGAGSSVVGDTVALMNRSSIDNVIDNVLRDHHATIAGTRTSPLTIPFASLPAAPQAAPGTTDVTVAKGRTLTLPAGSYADVEVRAGATLRLGGGTYQVASLVVDESAKVIAEAPTTVVIQNQLTTKPRAAVVADASVGVAASRVVIYVLGVDARCRADGADADGDDAGAVVVHVGTKNTIAANIEAPRGTVWIQSGTQATGAFIGEHVRIGVDVQLRLDSAFR